MYIYLYLRDINYPISGYRSSETPSKKPTYNWWKGECSFHLSQFLRIFIL